MTDKPLAYEAYQRLAKRYAARIDTKPHNAFYDRPAMLSLLPELCGRRVLDAGCGPGAYAEEFVARGASVVGCDMSDEMLRLAHDRLGDSVDLRRVDLNRPLDMFGGREFDLVFAALCLDYVADWNSLFREFRRVLRPGGRLLFSCGHPAFDAEYFDTEAYFSVERVECTWTGFGIPIDMPSYRRSLEEIVGPVLEAGLVLERVHEPLPTEEFRQADPKRFERLMRRPGFLCVRARA